MSDASGWFSDTVDSEDSRECETELVEEEKVCEDEKLLRLSENLCRGEWLCGLQPPPRSVISGGDEAAPGDRRINFRASSARESEKPPASQGVRLRLRLPRRVSNGGVVAMLDNADGADGV